MIRIKKTFVALSIVMVFSIVNPSMTAFADGTYVSYIVKSGDYLSKIAKQYDIDYYELAKINNIANVNLIYPGQKLNVPKLSSLAPIQTTVIKEAVPIVTLPQGVTPNHDISEIVDPNSQWEKIASGGGGFIEGLNFDKNGLLWMVDVARGKIMKIVDGQVISIGQDYKNPGGAKFGKDGLMYVTDQTGELYTVDTVTGERKVILNKYGPAALRGLNDCAFDDNGGLYITEPYGSDSSNINGRVFYLPYGGKELQLYVDNIAYPNGVTVSPNGKTVYISEFAQNRIISAPALGVKGPSVPHVFVRFKGGFGPDGLAVDTEGNLYAARCEAGLVTVIDQNGYIYGDINLPKEAGMGATNLVLKDSYMYVTESFKSEVWRIKIKKEGAVPYGLQ